MKTNIALFLLLTFYFEASSSDGKMKDKRFLLYAVNPGEGFNLSRDVYMRMAHLVHTLNQKDSWVLVLPPWGPLYHWRSGQSKVKWKNFFDPASLGLYVPVIEFEDFLDYIKEEVIDQVYYLQHYEEGWTSDDWEEKLDRRPCIEVPAYRSVDKDESLWEGWFWGYEEVMTRGFDCVSVQGFSSTLVPLLNSHDYRSVLVDRAETVMHDSFGSKEFWRIRRSMRFARHLVEEAERFRISYLDSSDELDDTVRPKDWREEHGRTSNPAKGGAYLGVHLRRRDFLTSRAKHTPNLKSAADQILDKAKKNQLSKVFIATDGSRSEIDELQLYLPDLDLYRYEGSKNRSKKFKEGGVAIIDQIICSKARFFMGSYESTFSFRIQEEREIMGFHPDVTFNRLCGDKEERCEQPTRWRAVF